MPDCNREIGVVRLFGRGEKRKVYEAYREREGENGKRRDIRKERDGEKEERKERLRGES